MPFLNADPSLAAALATAPNQVTQIALTTSVVVADNCSTVPLLASASFQGATWMDLKDFWGLVITANSDVPSNANEGIGVLWSEDGVNPIGIAEYGGTDTYYAVGNSMYVAAQKQARYAKAGYKNGATGQTTFAFTTIKSTIPLTPSTTPAQMVEDNNNQLTTPLLAGQAWVGGAIFPATGTAMDCANYPALLITAWYTLATHTPAGMHNSGIGVIWSETPNLADPETITSEQFFDVDEGAPSLGGGGSGTSFIVPRRARYATLFMVNDSADNQASVSVHCYKLRDVTPPTSTFTEGGVIHAVSESYVNAAMGAGGGFNGGGFKPTNESLSGASVIVILEATHGSDAINGLSLSWQGAINTVSPVQTARFVQRVFPTAGADSVYRAMIVCPVKGEQFQVQYTNGVAIASVKIATFLLPGLRNDYTATPSGTSGNTVVNVEGIAKGATGVAKATVSTAGPDHNGLDVNIVGGGGGGTAQIEALIGGTPTELTGTDLNAAVGYPGHDGLDTFDYGADVFLAAISDVSEAPTVASATPGPAVNPNQITGATDGSAHLLAFGDTAAKRLAVYLVHYSTTTYLLVKIGAAPTLAANGVGTGFDYYLPAGSVAGGYSQLKIDPAMGCRGDIYIKSGVADGSGFVNAFSTVHG